MKRIAAVLALCLALSACATIRENVTIDIEGIIASTCQQLAERLADQVADALEQAGTDATVDLPEIDVRALIDRADDLGCSPSDLSALVEDRLADVEAGTERARAYIDGIIGEVESAGG